MLCCLRSWGWLTGPLPSESFFGSESKGFMPSCHTGFHLNSKYTSHLLNTHCARPGRKWKNKQARTSEIYHWISLTLSFSFSFQTQWHHHPDIITTAPWEGSNLACTVFDHNCPTDLLGTYSPLFKSIPCGEFLEAGISPHLPLSSVFPATLILISAWIPCRQLSNYTSETIILIFKTNCVSPSHIAWTL